MSHISRRSLIASIAALPLLSVPAFAVTEANARSLVDQAVAEINRIISSGGSEAAIIGQFKNVFARYADEPYIAAYALGPAARQASQQQRSAFSAAFRDYVTAKYGRRFREFIGGQVIVQNARTVKNWVEVKCEVRLSGKAPFDVTFFVSDRTGQPKFFNLTVEGVSMLLSEREEIGAMLDQNRGNIDAVIGRLQQMS